jgi:hypothetical protein
MDGRGPFFYVGSPDSATQDINVDSWRLRSDEKDFTT